MSFQSVRSTSPANPEPRLFWLRIHVTGIELEDEDGRCQSYDFFQNYWIWASDVDGAKRQVFALVAKDTVVNAQESILGIRCAVVDAEERDSYPDEIPDANPSGKGFYATRWYHRLSDRFRGERLATLQEQAIDLSAPNE